MSDSVRPHRWQPPGSPVPGILQARTLKWVASSFSNAWKWKVKVKSLSRVRPSAIQWTAAFQAPPSMGFSRQEYWSGVPLPSPKERYTYTHIKMVLNGTLKQLLQNVLWTENTIRGSDRWKWQFSPSLIPYLSPFTLYHVGTRGALLSKRSGKIHRNQGSRVRKFGVGIPANIWVLCSFCLLCILVMDPWLYPSHGSTYLVLAPEPLDS